MPNKKHEPWYARTSQSAMDGLIDKSMNATDFSDKFEKFVQEPERTKPQKFLCKTNLPLNSKIRT